MFAAAMCRWPRSPGVRPGHRPGAGRPPGTPRSPSRKISPWGPCCRVRRAARAGATSAGAGAVSDPGRAVGTVGIQHMGGEQQMLAIRACLMGMPELVMFDEPSLGLAPRSGADRAARHHLRDLNREGPTCVLVEQNVAVSLRLANRAFVLENGRITCRQRRGLLADDRVRQALWVCNSFWLFAAGAQRLIAWTAACRDSRGGGT